MSEEEINKQVNEYIKLYDIENQLKEKGKEIERLNNILNELEKEKKQVLDKLNTPLAFTSSYQLNYQNAMLLIEEAKSILQGSDK